MAGISAAAAMATPFYAAMAKYADTHYRRPSIEPIADSIMASGFASGWRYGERRYVAAALAMSEFSAAISSVSHS